MIRVGCNFVSIIVCTHNRSEILWDCLHALTEQDSSSDQYEVIIVDNNSTDKTEEVSKVFVNNYPNFRYVKELITGLSHARNTGYKIASGKWVLYIDDDGKAHKNLVSRIIYTINHNPFDCFGGVYLPWYRYGKPRWMTEDMETNRSVGKDTMILEKENQFASGGIFAIKTEILMEVGGFPTHLGMTGKKMLYGEETYLQTYLRSKGYVIGFDPHSKIDHLVSRKKLNLSWHLRSIFMRGYAEWETLGDFPHLKYLFFKLPIEIILNLFIDFFSFLPKLFTKNYYWQNFILDAFFSFLRNMGRFAGGVRFRLKNGKSISFVN